jgi:hypothetical protein
MDASIHENSNALEYPKSPVTLLLAHSKIAFLPNNIDHR